MEKRRRVAIRSRDNESYLDEGRVSLYCTAVCYAQNELARNAAIRGEIR